MDTIALETVTEGSEPQAFKLDGVELPAKAQIQAASESPHTAQFVSNPLDVTEGRFEFNRPGAAKVILTWHTERGEFVHRVVKHFVVLPGHWGEIEKGVTTG
jgi:hypothetical protein